MKLKKLFLILLATSCLQAGARLQPTCYPDTTDFEFMTELEDLFEQEELGDVGDTSTWPVGMIYLHGWDDIRYDGSNDEKQNRNTLKEYALEMAKKRLRIALPASDHVRRDPYGRDVLHWRDKGLYDRKDSRGRITDKGIKTLAKEACDAGGGVDVELAHPRAMAGYSNGAYKVINLAEGRGGCKGDFSLGHYTRMIAIGARNSTACKTLRTDKNHSPATFRARLEGFMHGWDQGF